MHDISLPDKLYEEAAKVAGSQQLSIEQFVVEAVRLHIRAAVGLAEPLILDEVQKAKVLHALEEVERGEVLTLEEHKQIMAKIMEEHLRMDSGEPKKRKLG